MKSKIIFVCCSFLLLFSGLFFYPRWEKQGGEAQISWDASGYYWYLPSLFIYHDIKGQGFKDSILQKYKPTPDNDFQQGFKDPSGNYVLKYTAGIALMELPYFAIAHISARPLGYPADGFSKPYQFMVFAGAMFFVITGLFYLRRLLLFYYSDPVVAVVLLLLVLGTSYLNYCSIDVGMSHCWLFTLYVFILLNTRYYYETLKAKFAIRLGLLIGLTILIRPTEAVAVLIPLLWGMERISFATISARLSFFRKKLSHILAGATVATPVISLQFIYWKYASGNWLVYSYQNEGFSWLTPHFGEYTLNYQCGWLVYTPLMFAAIAGIIPFLKSGSNKVAILATILVNYYIVASWDGWIYGGRAMVQSYPLLLFPLAAFIRFIGARPLRIWIATPILLLLSYVNIWWTYQAHREGLASGQPATASYFWATVLRYNVPVEVQKLRDNHHNYTRPVTAPVLLYTNDFATENPEGKLVLKKDAWESRVYAFPRPAKSYRWFRASADIHIDNKENNIGHMTHFVIRFSSNGTVVQSNSIRLQRLMDANSTKNSYIDARTGNLVYDRIEILFYNENNGPQPCVIDNLKVIGFNE